MTLFFFLFFISLLSVEIFQNYTIYHLVKRTMKKKFFIFLSVFIILIFKFCDPGNPVPTLNSLLPDSAVAHMPTFTLTAYGADFVEGAKIVFNKVEKPTTFVSSTELTCEINPEDTAFSFEQKKVTKEYNGQAIIDLEVMVLNPIPVGCYSTAIDYPIYMNPIFLVPINISNNTENSYGPDIEVDSARNLNVVWQDNANGNFEIYLKRSTDTGENWSSVINISNNAASSSLPKIAVDSADNLNVVWYDYTPGNKEIYFSRSNDDVDIWSPAVNISHLDGRDSYDSYCPVIAVDSADNLNVVWHVSYSGATEKKEVYFCRSTDDGVSWRDAENIPDNLEVACYQDIGIDSSGNLNVVWMTNTSTPVGEIYFSRSTNNGVNWNSPVNISNLSGTSRVPSIAVDSVGNINVAWSDDSPGNHEIYFKRSTNNGVFWSSVKKISNSRGDAFDPTIALDSAGNLNVVWFDDTPGNEDIYFSRSIDNGATWSTPVNISNNSGLSSWPRIAVYSAGRIYVVWEDNTPGNWEIFFTRS